MSYRFGTADFISAVKVLKEVLECRRDITRYECNIDTETLQEEIDLENIDFKGLKYLIGEVSYVGKLADDIDRQKMRILIDKYLSSEKTVGEKGDADYLHLPHLGDKE